MCHRKHSWRFSSWIKVTKRYNGRTSTHGSQGRLLVERWLRAFSTILACYLLTDNTLRHCSLNSLNSNYLFFILHPVISMFAFARWPPLKSMEEMSPNRALVEYDAIDYPGPCEPCPRASFTVWPFAGL